MIRPLSIHLESGEVHMPNTAHKTLKPAKSFRERQGNYLSPNRPFKKPDAPLPTPPKSFRERQGNYLSPNRSFKKDD